MRGGRRLWTAGAAAALLVAVPAGWYFGSPWWTLWRIREAARAGDVGTLAAYVDYRAIGRRAAAEARATWSSVIPALLEDRGSGRLSAPTRRRIVAALRGRPAQLEELRPWFVTLSLRPGARRGDPYIVHRGLDRFEVRDRGMSEDHGPLLSFRRHGLGWKLEGVRWGQQ
jgi:hypothetical protein